MAVSSVVMVVEGVLQKHVSLAPIPTGIALYHGLANTFNILLVTDMSKKELDYWLALEGLNKHAGVKYNEGTLKHISDMNRRVIQVSDFRKERYNVDLVIEPDPAKCRSLLDLGFNCMNFLHAAYALPQWRPDYEHRVKPWKEIVDYQVEMAKLRAVEGMLSEEEKNTE